MAKYRFIRKVIQSEEVEFDVPDSEWKPDGARPDAFEGPLDEDDESGRLYNKIHTMYLELPFEETNHDSDESTTLERLEPGGWKLIMEV